MSSGDRPRALDPAVLDDLRAVLGDDELLAAIIGTFLAQTPAQLAALTAARQTGDWQVVSSTAHVIKGSALTFGAHRLASLCESLQASPMKAVDLEAAVQQEYDLVSSALAEYRTR